MGPGRPNKPKVEYNITEQNRIESSGFAGGKARQYENLSLLQQLVQVKCDMIDVVSVKF